MTIDRLKAAHTTEFSSGREEVPVAKIQDIPKPNEEPISIKPKKHITFGSEIFTKSGREIRRPIRFSS